MPIKFSKKLSRVQQRAEKVRNVETIQLGEHLATDKLSDIRARIYQASKNYSQEHC